MAKVIPLNNVTHMDVPPDRILKNLIGELDSVVILGYDKDNNEFLEVA